MTVSPKAFALATPDESTSMTRGSDENHCARAVTFSTELSDLTAFTLSCTDVPGAIDGGTLNSSRTADGVGVGVGEMGDGDLVPFPEHETTATARRTVAAMAEYGVLIRMAPSCGRKSALSVAAESSGNHQVSAGFFKFRRTRSGKS